MKSLLAVLAFSGMLALPGNGDQAYLRKLEKHRESKNRSYSRKDTSPFKKRKDRKHFDKLSYFPADESWKLNAEIRRITEPDTVKFPTSAGTVKDYLRWAELHFVYDGKALSLEAYRSVRFLSHPIYSKQLFIPFTDLTSGEDSYGGGRYMDVQLPGEEATSLELDFNYAYNPYCAYSDGWFCPIPPSRNFLEIQVRAGEMSYGEEH